MKIINLVGVFLICSFSTPCALKDTPNNLIIEKKSANYNKERIDELCLPIWNVFNAERDFVWGANIIFNQFTINYSTVDNTFERVQLNSFSFRTTLEVFTIDYDNTREIQYTSFIDKSVQLNSSITFNDNYGYLLFGGSLKLLDNSGDIGIGPVYRGTLELTYFGGSIVQFWGTTSDPIANIYLSFLIWLSANSNQVISDTGIQNIYSGYVLNYSSILTLIDFNELKQFYDYGYNIGDTEGYGRGTIDGYNTGYEQGYNVGESNGYSMGFDIGYESGYIDGNEGRGDFDFVWLTTLFSSLNAILSVEILNGFRLWYLFAVPLVVALIVGVMKLLR